MPSPPWRSLLALEVLFVLTWNSGFIGAEYGLPYASTFTLLLWRYLILTGLIAMALIVRGRLHWPGASAATLAGLVGVLAHGGWLGCVLLALQMGAPAGARPARQRLLSASCPPARSLCSTLPPHARSPSRSCATLVARLDIDCTCADLSRLELAAQVRGNLDSVVKLFEALGRAGVELIGDGQSAQRLAGAFDSRPRPSLTIRVPEG